MPVLVPRPRRLSEIRRALADNPVCALLGPRQCGKTTLARQYAQGRKSTFIDLETIAGRRLLAEPEFALSSLRGLVVIDEVQRMPELFTILRPLADRPRAPASFLILGSAAPEVVRGVSESLAGRVAFVDLGGFDLDEVGAERERTLWLRGGLPRSFLARTDALSIIRREALIRTILERDLPQLGVRIPAETLRRFWMMLAHYHGQTWNGSELARALGATEPTVHRYLDMLTGAFLVRQLQPWFANIAKRQHKAPKVYLRDSGLLHALLGVRTWNDLLGHPKFGASWEGFALEQVLSIAGPRQAFCWGTHGGAELDLLLVRRGKFYGIEFKAGDAPAMTKSLHVALDDLKLDRAWIIYPGEHRYRLHQRVEAVPLAEFLTTARRLRLV
jgi:uncharacterized protein